MNQEIIEAIQKSLPAIQMDALKTELAKAAKVADLEITITTLRKQIEIERELQQSLSKSLAEANARAKKTEELELQERNLKVQMLEIKLQCEQVVSSNIKELAMAAFRNPTIHKSFNKPVAVPGSSTCTGYVEDRQVGETTTVS